MKIKRISVFLVVFSLMFLPQVAFGGGAVTGATTETVKQVTEEVVENSTTCQTDADCVLVSADCCGCRTNGKSTAVRKSQETAHNKALNKYCSSHQAMCSMSTICSQVQAKCQNSQCVALGPKTVPVSASVFVGSSSGTVTPLPNPGIGSHVKINNSANESAIKKAKKQRKLLMLAAFASAGAGIYLLKKKCNPTDFPMGDGKIDIPKPENFQPSDTTGITSAEAVGGLTRAINNIGMIGGPPKTTYGCVLGPLAIASAAMMLKRSMEMKKTIAQLSGGSSKLLADMEESMNSISDIDVPCLEDPTKTCKLVNGGTHITTLDGSPPRSVKEVAENLPPHDEQTLAALEEAIKSQEETLAKARESLGPDFNPIAELTGQSESSTPVGINPLPLNQNPTQALNMETPPVPSFNQQGMPLSLPSLSAFSSGTNNWMQAQCEVENSVHTVSDVGGGMVDVLCGSSGGPPANVRQTPNPPNVSSCTQEQTAVAVRDSTVSEWASVSCVDSTSSSPLVSLRTTDRGQWADVTCPAVSKVVTVRMANTDRWVSVLCGDLQAGQVVSLRSGQSIGTDGALYAQFAGSSYGSGNSDVESMPFGTDRIASVNENVFAVVSTQYQHLSSNGEFMEEGPSNNASPFVIPASSGSE